MTERISLLIVDDHPLVREGLRAVVELEEDMDVVGEAESGDEAIRLAQSLQPDVILMDLLMPEKTGSEAIETIVKDDPSARILVLTSVDNVVEILPAIRSGALGYVSKNAPPEELLEAIRTVYRRSVVLPIPVAQSLLSVVESSPTSDPLASLTDREIEILTLVAQGLDNDEIAARLVISPRTVSVHVSRFLAKLELSNRTQAALYALRRGLVDL